MKTQLPIVVAVAARARISGIYFNKLSKSNVFSREFKCGARINKKAIERINLIELKPQLHTFNLYSRILCVCVCVSPPLISNQTLSADSINGNYISCNTMHSYGSHIPALTNICLHFSNNCRLYTVRNNRQTQNGERCGMYYMIIIYEYNSITNL